MDSGFDGYRSGVVASAGRCVLRWMLKKVPDWGGEWGRWSGLLRLPADKRDWDTRRPAMPAVFVGGASRRRWHHPDRGREAAPTAAWDRAVQRPLPSKNSGRNQASSRHYRPDLEPASASPDDQCRQDRHNPAPIMIEAVISSSHGRQRKTLCTDKKICNRSPMPHIKPQTPPTSSSNSCRL